DYYCQVWDSSRGLWLF
nr:immunoglobulin light chain junction region [Macaca mulatta]MOX18189.1 immunoglobulin light chain junction region [Macaca mulatta]MOX18330.1 immunoglobulin light chain junction region [Macaca mulatta]MOX18653.1 immunoglobulin light chain junction region [Macaca mulatta]MOX18675.1 immunoglobulin light chain junction region [Macaca mulatta]